MRAIGRAHELVGLTECLCCAKEIPAKKTAGGKLSLSCTWCDLPLYVNPGTEAYTRIMGKIRLVEKPAPAPAATPAVPPKPPAPAKAEPPARSFSGPLFGGS